MKIVIAPDSFKGSISASDLCTSIREGIHRVHPCAEVVEVPLADGGEGTMENMVYATNGSIYKVNVKDPLGRLIQASYGVLGDKETVIIEMAQASGLPLVAEEERNPLDTTSYGTGELIRHALESGHRKFIIGLGGSATNDGGVGMLRALGVKFYDQEGKSLDGGGASLIHLSYYDDTDLDPRLKDSTFIIASDVINPLCGVNGASAIFGPQKGATHEMVQLLDQALLCYAEVILKQKGIDILHEAGVGAAGGMGAGLIAFLDAKVRSGIEIVIETSMLKENIKGANLLITGEGKLDQQTLSGKVVSGVCSIAKLQNIPVYALCGVLELNGEKMDELGVVAGLSIVPGPCTLQEAMENTSTWASDRAEQLMRVIQLITKVE